MLNLERLNIRLPSNGELKTVISDVTLQIPQGVAMGLVGESGSGKSMTARAIVRNLPKGSVMSGAVEFKGKHIHAMNRDDLQHFRRDGVGFIFQDPKSHINPVRTIGDFLTEALIGLRGMPKREAEAVVVGYLERVGVTNAFQRLRQYPHQLSGGLLQRVMIASVCAMQPSFIIADEPTTALDVTTQAEVMVILMELRQRSNMSMLFISHDLDLALAVCDNVAVMYAGTIVESGPAWRHAGEVLHPYTTALIASRPRIEIKERLQTVGGKPRSASEVGCGCVFEARCPYALDVCRNVRPALRALEGRAVACHRAEELRAAGSLTVTVTK